MKQHNIKNINQDIQDIKNHYKFIFESGLVRCSDFGHSYHNQYERSLNEFINFNLNRQTWFLNEKKHLHEPELSSFYRQKINDIIEKLWNEKDNIQYETVLYNEPQFKQYIFNNPFFGDKTFEQIETLKIFVNFNSSQLDAISVIENISNKAFNQKFTPLFKLKNTYVDTVSIFIYIPSQDCITKKVFKNNLLEILSHELAHVMNLIYDVLNVYNAGSLNEFTYIIKNKIDFNKIKNQFIGKSDIVQIKNLNEFMYIISEMLYYTQKTEIKGFLESHYNEYIKSKYYNNEQHTYYIHYSWLLKNVDYMLDNLNYIQNEYKQFIEFLIKELKNIQQRTLIKKEKYPKELLNTKYSFKHILLFWKKRLQLFLKKADAITDYVNKKIRND